MGTITVAQDGSFPRRSRTFSAIDHGHAHAVAQAIEYLAREILPEAVSRDHALHEAGDKPKKGFCR